MYLPKKGVEILLLILIVLPSVLASTPVVLMEKGVTGGITTQIDLTSRSYTGNVTNGTLKGYSAVHNICNVEFGGYMCTWNEVDNFQRTNNISTISGVAWVIGGPPKYAPADHPVSDCSGFTINSTTSTSPLGNFWNFDVKYGIAGNCGLSYPLACCK